MFFDTPTGGFDFRPVEGADHVADDGAHGPGLYELVMTMADSPRGCHPWHARMGITTSASAAGPPYPEWRTRDLWAPHPDPAKAAFAWRFVSRRDDLVAFSTGVNAHSAAGERAITSHRLVGAAMLVGNARRQPLALVELAGAGRGGDEVKEARPLAGSRLLRRAAEDIWEESIAPANEEAQVHIRVQKTHVVLVPSGGFVRTAKGSVVRKATEAKFRGLIDEVYERHGDRWQDGKERFGSISAVTTIDQETHAG